MHLPGLWSYYNPTSISWDACRITHVITWFASEASLAIWDNQVLPAPSVTTPYARSLHFIILSINFIVHLSCHLVSSWKREHVASSSQCTFWCDMSPMSSACADCRAEGHGDLGDWAAEAATAACCLAGGLKEQLHAVPQPWKASTARYACACTRPKAGWRCKEQ